MSSQTEQTSTSPPEPRNVDCNLCGASDEEQLLPVETSFLVRCRACGLVYINPQPPDGAIESMYNENYFTNSDGLTWGYPDYLKDSKNILRTFDLRFRKLGRYRKTPGRLLDVGCAYGFGLLAAKEAGWEVQGLELAGDVAAQAREEYGLDVQQGVLEELPATTQPYDLIVMWDVIEHVPDPIAVMQAAHRLLAPDGLLVMMTPNIDGFMSKVSGTRWVLYERGCTEHLYYFSPESITKSLEKAGFDVVKCSKWGLGGKFVDLDFVFSRLEFYLPWPFKWLRRSAQKLKIQDWSFYADAGDNMVVIAQKAGSAAAN